MRCQRGVRFLLIHKHVPGRTALISLRCGCWSCAACATRLRGLWVQHLQPLFAAAGALYVLTCTKEAWLGHVQRRVRRAGGDFVRVLHKGATVTVVTTADVPDAAPVANAAAASLLLAHLLQDTHDQKPVSTSRGWKLRPKLTESEWGVVGRTRLGPDEARQVLNAMGVPSHRFHDTQSVGLLWKTPPGLEEAVCRALLEHALSESYYQKNREGATAAADPESIGRFGPGPAPSPCPPPRGQRPDTPPGGSDALAEGLGLPW